MDWIGFLAFFSLLALIGLALWWVWPTRLSKQEKAFIEYAQTVARNRSVKKENLPGFLFENKEKLRLLFASESGPLVLNNMPHILDVIKNTYRGA